MSSPELPAAALEGFRRAVQQQRVAHAYLLIGDVRTEGVPFAVEMLQTLLCPQPNPPCRQCPACRQVAVRAHPDVLWLEPESRSRKIQAETIRQTLLPRLSQTTFIEGGWRAAVLLDADCLTDAAANVFLKMLEEPPPRAIILLLSGAPRSLLPTIISRCQRIRLSGAAVEASDWQHRALELLARGAAATGAVERMALVREWRSLFEEARVAAEEEVSRLEAESAPPAPEGETVEVDPEVRAARIGARELAIRKQILETMLLWQRDIWLYTVGGPPEAARWPEHAEAVRAQARRYTAAQAAEALRALEDLNRRLERSLPAEAALDAFLQALPNRAA